MENGKPHKFMTARTQKRSIWLKTLASLFRPKKIYTRRALPKAGAHHDLKELFAEVNAQYFSGSLDLQIEWSGSGQTRSRSVIRLGYYNPRKELIKISRVLDYPHVPKYFVSFIVYHEILHHVLPPMQAFGSKRRIHHHAFRQKEKEFHEYEQSQAFLKDFKKELFTPCKKL